MLVWTPAHPVRTLWQMAVSYFILSMEIKQYVFVINGSKHLSRSYGYS